MWLLIFAFSLGFATTVAEPALIAVGDEAAKVAAEGGMIENTEASQKSYSLGLRLTVAFSVGLAILIGVIANNPRLASAIFDHSRLYSEL